jgi:hypothetical protein
MAKRSPKGKAKLKPVKCLIKKLDKLVSEVVRLEEPTCCTCKKLLPFKERQCGHYFGRIHYSTRWERKNCHTQCVACNVFKSGNYTEYARVMYGLYGKKGVEKLRLLSLKNVDNLRELIEKKTKEYNKKLLKLKKST